MNWGWGDFEVKHQARCAGRTEEIGTRAAAAGEGECGACELEAKAAVRERKGRKRWEERGRKKKIPGNCHYLSALFQSFQHTSRTTCIL